ncbi:hypothetical protein MOD60_07455 [Bacillus spizizenii]|nr:hypothetical protein [Bacillus spizizenii]MCY9357994.1 hypothetical protein [Bacillus spizizenii]
MQNNSLMEAKAIGKYLLKRYGRPYNENMTIQQIFKEAVKRDHDKDQLKQMSDRLNMSLAVSDDLSSLKTIPFTILTSITAGIISIYVVFFTFYFNTFNSFSSTLIQKDKENKIDPKDLLNTIFTGGKDIFELLIYFSVIMLFIMFGLWFFLITVNKKYYQRQRGFKLLLDEVIKEIEEEDLAS